MEIFNPPYFTQSKNSFQGKLKTLFLLVSLIIASQTSVFSQVSLEGSWGVTFPVFGGERLDSEVSKGHDPVAGAQELVDELPMTGHVITNLSYFANSHYFPMSANTNVNVASEIHPALVPSAANDEIIFDVLKIFKNSGKKIILYISTNYMDRLANNNTAAAAAWTSYYTTKFGGDEYAAYKDLIRGFLENVKDYADGYWFDTASALIQDGNYTDFVNMFKEVDPTALMAASNGDYLEIDGTQALVDSDGVDDEDPRDYKIIMWETSSSLTDFTHGHITPLGTGAPPNSWGYEEFTIPDMVETPVYVNSGGEVLKHGWFPIRAQWHASGADLIFNTEEAYRFMRRITDAGAAVTFANTVQYTASSTNRGHMMIDEMAIMKEINRRLQMNPKPDYVPYTRPDGAKLVGETAPNYHQIIDFPALPAKDVGDADFTPFVHASSGLSVSLSSSNTNVATIVNGKIRIVGSGTSNITATQSGNNIFGAAENVTRQLKVSGSSDPDNGDNLALNGTASHSGTVNGATADLAIDGDTNGIFIGESVTASAGPQAWWEVDLGSEYTIDEIHIYNRTNACCIDRLSDFIVSVIDAEGNTTFSQRFTEAPTPSIIINASGALGEVVRVQSNTDITMNLAEVEVYGDIPVVVPPSGNLALNGRASQSGTQNDGIAEYGNDGDTNGAFGGDSVIAATGPNAWWEVDLGNEFSIDEIHVYNRTDPCCIERLTNFTVSVLDSDGNSTYSQTFTQVPNPSMIIDIPSAVGQTVRVQSNQTYTLNLAEVEVYGDAITKQDQVITFPSFPTVLVGDPDFDPGVTASSGLPITYTSGNTNVAIIVNGKIRILSEGQTYITASQAGNADFNAAPNRSRVLTVNASAIGSSTLVHITKRNAKGYAIDGNWGGENTQNVYLYGQNPNNVNQQWLEIDRGDGYYSYQKVDTGYALDGGGIGENEENVYLWEVIENNQNQHWQKVDVGGGAFKLIMRSNPNLAINGGSGGSNLQNVNLWNSSSTSQNLHWIITPVAEAKDINDIDAAEPVIYPNPVSSTTATIQGAADSVITIYDMKGSLLLSQPITNENETLDLSLLSSGVYNVQVNKIDTISTLRIVKE